MFSISSFVLLLLVHWLADFALQTPEQANNKYNNPTALGAHVLTYGASMGVAIVCLFAGNHPGAMLACAVIVVLVSHFIIDGITSKLTHYLYQEKRYHDFFVVIGFDQLLHVLTILAICYL